MAVTPSSPMMLLPRLKVRIQYHHGRSEPPNYNEAGDMTEATSAHSKKSLTSQHHSKTIHAPKNYPLHESDAAVELESLCNGFCAHIAEAIAVESGGLSKKKKKKKSSQQRGRQNTFLVRTQ